MWDFISTRNIPVLGICYGLQELTHHFGGDYTSLLLMMADFWCSGTVASSTEREFGRAMVTKCEGETSSEGWEMLFSGASHPQFWMSHGDKVTILPEGFVDIARTDHSEHAGISHPPHHHHPSTNYHYLLDFS